MLVTMITVVLHDVYMLHSIHFILYMPATPVSSAMNYRLVMALQQASRCFSYISASKRALVEHHAVDMVVLQYVQ